METRANFVLIGAFTLAVIAGAFLFVLWFSGLTRTADHQVYAVLFDGSVAGLTRGSAVQFNGIRVGEVTEINLVADDPRRVEVLIQVVGRVPINQDTKASLEVQGLTGGAAIALTGGASDSPPLTSKGGNPPVIVGDAVRNIDAFSKALADNASGVNAALSGIADLGKKIGPLSDRLQGLSDDVDKLVKAVDPAKVSGIVGDVKSLTGSLADNKAAINSTITDAAALAKRLNDTAGKLDSALGDFDNLVKAVDTKKIATFVDGANTLGQTLQQHQGDIDAAVKNATELTAKLNHSADKIDGLMTSLQGFVGSPDLKGPLGELGDAARSVRQLADNLDVARSTTSTARSAVSSAIPTRCCSAPSRTFPSIKAGSDERCSDRKPSACRSSPRTQPRRAGAGVGRLRRWRRQ